jgi:hypothetical protein
MGDCRCNMNGRRQLHRWLCFSVRKNDAYDDVAVMYGAGELLCARVPRTNCLDGWLKILACWGACAGHGGRGRV